MQLEATIRRMAAFPTVLQAVVSQFSPAELRWRPEDGGWTVLEILGHLASEEVDDFRMRLRLTLESPETEWPPIDPVETVRQSGCNEQEAADLLQEFSARRAESIEWLRRLGEADWSLSYRHPHLGIIRASDLLVSWIAHDALHLRQLAKRMYQISLNQNAKADAGYAGEWRA